MVPHCGTRWSYLFEISLLCWQFNSSMCIVLQINIWGRKKKKGKNDKERKEIQEVKLNK